ncbi:MAG TPA: alpha/beta hydrolase [Thermoanaerobaculia bacterium]
MIRIMAALVTIVIAAVVAIIAVYFYARHLRRSSMFFPMKYPQGAWDTSSLPVKPEEQWITTPDGVRLNAWLFRARDANAPMLVYFHGNAGNIGERGPVASRLAAHGVSVLLFDWRGYGKSEGTPTEEALFIDSLAAYDYARAEARDHTEAGHTEAANISVYGESLGGPYAAYAAKIRGANSVVIESSFPSLSEIGDALYAPIPLGWTARKSLTTARWLNDAGAPVLVMHGKPDAVIPFAMGVSLYKQLRVPKEMLVSETAGHCEIANAEGERFYGMVTRFVSSHSKPS